MTFVINKMIFIINKDALFLKRCICTIFKEMYFCHQYD